MSYALIGGLRLLMKLLYNLVSSFTNVFLRKIKVCAKPFQKLSYGFQSIELKIKDMEHLLISINF